MPRQNFNTPAERSNANRDFARRVAELMHANPSPLTRLLSEPTLSPPKEPMMNEPVEQPRMTSLDRRIEASRLRGERERVQQGKPVDGLTSQLSTKDKDVPLQRGGTIINIPEFKGLLVEGAQDCPADAKLRPHTMYLTNGWNAMPKEAGEDILQAITQLNGQDAELARQHTPPWLQATYPGNQRVAKAMSTLIQAMKAEPQYALNWHASLVMAYVSETPAPRLTESRRDANRAAARFMECIFGVDTTQAHQAPQVSEKAVRQWPVTVFDELAARVEAGEPRRMFNWIKREWVTVEASSVHEAEQIQQAGSQYMLPKRNPL